jgi:hypothetical protein
MPRRKRSEEGAAQVRRWHWTEAEKQVALEASLSASELGPTKKEAPDAGQVPLCGMEVPLCEHAAILFKQLALGRLKHLFAGGEVISRTKRRAAVPPFALGANTREVAELQGGNCGRDLLGTRPPCPYARLVTTRHANFCILLYPTRFRLLANSLTVKGTPLRFGREQVVDKWSGGRDGSGELMGYNWPEKFPISIRPAGTQTTFQERGI